MKIFSKHRTLVLLVSAISLLAACTKEKSDVRLPSALATSQTLNIKSDAATVVGFVVAQGDGFIEKGVCYNTAPAPTTSNNKVAYVGQAATATFNVTLPGLSYATKYYARAYATDASGTIYGDEVSFTTLPVIPTVTTAVITGVTGNAAAGGGNVTVAGGAEVTARGICFGLSHNPTVADSKTSDAKGTGAFTSALTSLKGNTLYYVRAYATNSAGTAYGAEVSFTTLVDLPVVSTTSVTGITKVAAVSGGAVTYDGGGTVSAKGLAWGTAANPTVTGTKIDGGNGFGAFVSNLSGLTKYTTYHVRAYATNSAGTAYGADITFTTLADILTWNIPGDYVEASYPGSGLTNWSPDKSPQVISTIAAGDKLEGYVYMANASNAWKFATQTNWNGPNYGDGGAGKLDGNAGDIKSSAGYYLLSANSTTMTYTAVATTWGVIGDATPGGWGSQTNMNYTPSSRTFALGVHMTSGGSFKFRGTSDWKINYGSDKADGTLRLDGGNIPVAVESDYLVTLDLSHPNVYTYTANRWGLIGDATPGGWGTDTNMTWDATNKVFKVTLNLTTGNIKFRANDGWDLNYGGALGALTQGGSDIPIAAAGNYTITFDVLKAVPSCIITKN